MVPTEKRRSLRFRYCGGLKITWGRVLLNGRVRDIGAGGMFVVISDPFPIGAAFTAVLVAENPMLLKCVVRWIEPGRGMGVSIVTPGQEGRKRFAVLIGTLADNCSQRKSRLSVLDKCMVRA
jgi:hypothetical protein